MESKREEDDFKTKTEQNIRQLIERFEPRVIVKDVTVNIRYAVEDHTKWRLSEAQRTKNSVIQLIVSVRGSIKPEYSYDGQSLDLEDTIPLL